MEYISVEEFEELIDKDELIETLLNIGLIEEENTMHKLIKVTPDYWGDLSEPKYMPFTYDNIAWAISQYTDDTVDTEGYEDLLAGVVGAGRYEEMDYRGWDEPSGHYIDIVELTDEIQSIFDDADRKIAKLKEMAK